MILLIFRLSSRTVYEEVMAHLVLPISLLIPSEYPKMKMLQEDTYTPPLTIAVIIQQLMRDTLREVL